jgi:predicted transposase/invertase (TIGR01784 family)
MRPVFADLKSDLVFKKVFGSEEHKHILIALLNAILDLTDDRKIVDVTYLREEERPRVEELKHSVVDVKCRDQRGIFFVVEMQVLQVEGFDKRVVYNASKAYVNQIARGEEYLGLNDVIAVSICDFELWPDVASQPRVPLVSHWRLQEQHNGRIGLSHVQYVFVELPKLPLDRPPCDLTEEWAYVFRRAPTLREVPAHVQHEGPRSALEAARSAHFSAHEWEAYDSESVAIQDARGAITFAERRGEARGEARGELKARRQVLRTLLAARNLVVAGEHEMHIESCNELTRLDAWIVRGMTASSIDHVFEAVAETVSR